MTLPLSYSRAGGEWRIRTSVGRGPADLQSAAFDRSANSPRYQFLTNSLGAGAGDGTRTRDLLITNQLLYQLSYASKTSNFQRHDEPRESEQRTSFDGAAEELRVIAELPNGTQEVTIPSTCARSPIKKDEFPLASVFALSQSAGDDLRMDIDRQRGGAARCCLRTS